MAHELGLFEKYGLSVRLSREIGWATIRDKIIYGELDAAHALAAMPFTTTLGLGSISCDCVSALVLNLNGDAITLSRDLWMRGVRDARTLRAEIESVREEKIFTFGVVFPFSSHNFLIRQWLKSGGIDPDQDVRIVVVPAPSMFDNLKSGNLDGYCVGEPWNSLAVKTGLGWCPTTSVQLAPMHPEKVLMVRRQFAETQESDHLSLVAALLEACAFCDQRENREQVIATIAQPKYVNTSADVLRAGLMDRFDFGNGREEDLADFHIFSRHDANEPSTDKAAWVLRNLITGGHFKDRRPDRNGMEIFRPDIFQRAMELLMDAKRNEIEPKEEPALVSYE